MTQTENTVGIDDVFFSTTDDKGHITLANDVFVRLSGYSREELTGAAHNIVRHPQMPAGVFRQMWDQLSAGRPFAGYVRNRTKDGGSYDVLATVTPLPSGGYLSVRTRPVTETAEAAWQLYAQLAAAENDSQEGRRAAAEATAAVLPKRLGQPDYEHFQWAILPAELAAREQAGAKLPQAPGAQGEVRLAVDALAQVHERLGGWTAEQDKIARLVAKLTAMGERLGTETRAAERVNAEMDSLDIAGAERTLLLAPLQIWTNMHGIVGSYLDQVRELSSQLLDASRQTAFTLALVRLQAAAAAVFAVELTRDGSAEALRVLCTALRDGLDQLDGQVARHRRLTTRLNAKAGSVARIMQPSQAMVSAWLTDTDAEALSPQARGLVETVAATVHSLDETAADLTATAGELESVEEQDTAGMRQAVREVESAVQRANRGW